MELQQLLENFGQELQAYIREEVRREVAGYMRGSMAAPSNEVTHSNTPASSSASDVQASLNQLATLAASDKRPANTMAVDSLVSQYGSGSNTSVSAPVMPAYESALPGEVISDLSNVPNKASSISMDVPQDMNATGKMSGIHSFLNKIRQRKNLNSN